MREIRIQLNFYNIKNNKHDKRNYIGKFALETMILSLLSEFYGEKISNQVKVLLTDSYIGVDKNDE